VNKFLFIIPLTPKDILTEERIMLQNLCFGALLKQNYKYWKVLIIGDYIPDTIKNTSYYYWLNSEGTKGEKIPLAVDYIIANSLNYDYLIRLDDDDIFNPYKLNELKYTDFDIYVDKQQFFWNSQTRQIASRTWYWFPNTTIQKTKHALSTWNNIYEKKVGQSYVIDTAHGFIHIFYKQKRIIFSKPKSPLYLRSISSSSSTFKDSIKKEKYINSFGNWYNNNLKDFLFLGDSYFCIQQSQIKKIKNMIYEIKFRLKYHKIVIK